MRREHVDRDAHGAELEALEVLGLGDRLLEPAERLRRHRAVRERHHVGADRGVELVQQLLAAAVLVPGEQLVRVHAERRARAPQRERVLLAVVVDQHAVAAVERALGHRVEQAERRHHGAGGQHLDPAGRRRSCRSPSWRSRWRTRGRCPSPARCSASACEIGPLRLGDHREAEGGGAAWRRRRRAGIYGVKRSLIFLLLR